MYAFVPELPVLVTDPEFVGVGKQEARLFGSGFGRRSMCETHVLCGDAGDETEEKSGWQRPWHKKDTEKWQY